MKGYRLFVLLALLSLTTWCHAAGLKWLARPQYDYITFYSEDILKCMKDGKVQLVDKDGRVLLPHLADSVTDFTEGNALVLEKIEADTIWYRIRGILGEEYHDYHETDGIYYTERFSYCSEGYISVANERGEQGYLDVNGKLVIKCTYLEARPFKKGWASVLVKEGQAVYIDAQKKNMRIKKLTDASSFNDDGRAVARRNDKFLILTAEGEVLREYDVPAGSELPVRQYDYVYDLHPENFVLESKKLPNYESRYKTYTENGKQGVMLIDETTVVWPQFGKVVGVAKDFVIIVENGLWGAVAFLEGDFSASLDVETIEMAPKQEPEEREYTLTVPKGLKGVTLFLDYGSGKQDTLAWDKRTSYRFVPLIGSKTKSITVRSRVEANDLLQWEDEFKVPVKPLSTSIVVSDPSCVTANANKDGVQKVKSVVTNRSKFPVTVSAVIEVELPDGSKNVVKSNPSPLASRTLQPNEKMECVVQFNVQEKGDVKVVVTAKSNGREYKKEANLTLLPFYW